MNLELSFPGAVCCLVSFELTNFPEHRIYFCFLRYIPSIFELMPKPSMPAVVYSVAQYAIPEYARVRMNIPNTC